MKKTLATLLILLSSIVTRAQIDKDIVWQKSFGGSLDDYAYDFALCLDGGFIISGYTESNNGDVTSYKGDGDVWLVKTQSNGTKVWQKTYGGSDYDAISKVIQTKDSGYAFIATTYSTDGDIIANKGNADVWIVRLDKNGNVMWAKTYGGSDYDFGYDIIETADSGFAFVGSVYSADGDVTLNKGGYDLWVVEIDKDGLIISQKTYGGSGGDVGTKIVRLNNKYIIGGYTDSNNGDISNNKGGIDFWVICIENMNTIVWSSLLGGSDDERLLDLKVDNNEIAAVGFTYSSDGDVTKQSGNEDIWFVKCDTLGSLKSQTSFGGTGYEEGNSISYTNDGGYLVSGYTTSSNGDLITDNSSCSQWVFKLNNNGSIVWQKTLGGDSVDIAYSGKQLQDGSYMVCGFTASNNKDVAFNNGGNSGTNDIWLYKLSSSTSIKQTAELIRGTTIYPNPSDAIINVKGLEPYDCIMIYNSIGEILVKQIVTDESVTINIQELVSGVYNLVINRKGEMVETVKFSKK